MRLAIVVDPNIPVPPTHYGGIERIAAFLIAGLSRRGHAITLLAHPESQTSARLLPYGLPPHTGAWIRQRELLQAAGSLWQGRHGWDVVHSFGRLAALLPLLGDPRLGKIQSYQREVHFGPGLRTMARRGGDRLRFTACASHLYRDAPIDFRQWSTIFNGVEMETYPARTEVAPDAPLVFLGRLEPIKGVHHAIAIARRSGRKLVIAGNRVPSAQRYFETEIAPHCDDAQIRYVGPVNDAQKAQLLGAAAALLMPVDWDEPFGIVMAEALACGTPVIGFPRGSLPEVIRPGVNGFLCDSVAAAAQSVSHLGRLDRAAVRADAEDRFSAERIVDQYERLYFELARPAIQTNR